MKYVAATTDAMPFTDEYFNIVSSFNSLDHTEDCDQVIAEIFRVLKPGGLFLVLTEVNHEPTACEPQSFSWTSFKKSQSVSKFSTRGTMRMSRTASIRIYGIT